MNRRSNDSPYTSSPIIRRLPSLLEDPDDETRFPFPALCSPPHDDRAGKDACEFVRGQLNKYWRESVTELGLREESNPSHSPAPALVEPSKSTTPKKKPAMLRLFSRCDEEEDANAVLQRPAHMGSPSVSPWVVSPARPQQIWDPPPRTKSLKRALRIAQRVLKETNDEFGLMGVPYLDAFIHEKPVRVERQMSDIRKEEARFMSQFTTAANEKNKHGEDWTTYRNIISGDPSTPSEFSAYWLAQRTALNAIHTRHSHASLAVPDIGFRLLWATRFHDGVADKIATEEDAYKDWIANLTAERSYKPTHFYPPYGDTSALESDTEDDELDYDADEAYKAHMRQLANNLAVSVLLEKMKLLNPNLNLQDFNENLATGTAEGEGDGEVTDRDSRSMTRVASDYSSIEKDKMYSRSRSSSGRGRGSFSTAETRTHTHTHSSSRGSGSNKKPRDPSAHDTATGRTAPIPPPSRSRAGSGDGDGSDLKIRKTRPRDRNLSQNQEDRRPPPSSRQRTSQQGRNTWSPPRPAQEPFPAAFSRRVTDWEAQLKEMEMRERMRQEQERSFGGPMQRRRRGIVVSGTGSRGRIPQFTPPEEGPGTDVANTGAGIGDAAGAASGSAGGTENAKGNGAGAGEPTESTQTTTETVTTTEADDRDDGTLTPTHIPPRTRTQSRPTPPTISPCPSTDTLRRPTITTQPSTDTLRRPTITSTLRRPIPPTLKPQPSTSTLRRTRTDTTSTLPFLPSASYIPSYDSPYPPFPLPIASHSTHPRVRAASSTSTQGMRGDGRRVEEQGEVGNSMVGNSLGSVAEQQEESTRRRLAGYFGRRRREGSQECEE